MTKSELLNNTEFKKADGSLPIIYITSDDDVVKVGSIVNSPMVIEDLKKLCMLLNSIRLKISSEL